LYDTRKKFRSTLSGVGWAVRFLEDAAPIPDDCDRTKEVAKGVKVTPADNPEFRKYVQQLVGETIRFLPEKEAAKITVEQKRDIARVTTEVLREGVLEKIDVEKKGRTGSLAYWVGTFRFESSREIK